MAVAMPTQYLIHNESMIIFRTSILANLSIKGHDHKRYNQFITGLETLTQEGEMNSKERAG